MLEMIYAELAKLIAKEVFNYAKGAGSDTYKSLKNLTQLTKRGYGLPEPILREFEKAFLATLKDHLYKRHGFACWRQGGSEIESSFLLSSPLTDTINTTNWSDAAEDTSDGVIQIKTLGGRENYQKAISLAIPAVFVSAIKSIVGRFVQPTISTQGYRVLSPVMTMKIAPEGSQEFKENFLFYTSYGKEKKTLDDYKSARKLITGKWLSKGTLPSKGPYLTNL